VAKSLKVKIIGFSPEEGKLIVSEKATQEKEIEEILKKYKVGDIIEGIVTGIVDFGVFIKFDSLEGLAHISELAYQLIENPHDIVKIGDKIKAKIIDVDKDKISLSIKALQKNPWDEVEKKYQVNQTVKGTVTKFNPFGAFVQLDKNIHGLAHISEFETEKKMTDALTIGEKCEFKILSIKPSEYRMALKPLLKKE
jgi:small subunit ribosomal protein S1